MQYSTGSFHTVWRRDRVNMPSYNRIIVIGNLTRDPEIRYVNGGGKAVTKFTLGVNRKTKGAWDRLGEICNQYLKKGMSALVEGRLAIRSHETKDGEKRKAVEIVAGDMQMLDSKARSGGDAGSSYGGESRAVASSGGFEDDAIDDEIPF